MKPPIFLAVVLSLSLSACCVPGRPVESLHVLQDVAAGANIETALKRNTPEPVRQTVRYAAEGGERSADIYVPGKGEPEAGVLLVPGVAREGHRDARIVALARTLARANFAVMAPDLPNVRRLEVSGSDVRELAAAFDFLVSQPEFAPKGRAGMAAASYAVGPAVLAALDPNIRDRVRFVFGIGGYYNLEEVLTFAITGHYRDRTKSRPRWQRMSPSGYAKWVFLASNLRRVPDAADRGLLQQIADRKLEDPDAPVESLASRLGPQGQPFYRLLIADDPREIPQLVSNLPAPVQREVNALNLAAHNLESLQADLVLIHGRNDNSIPFTEGRALAAAAPRARLFLVNNLAHVDVEKGGLLDALRLWCAVDRLLSHR